MAGQHLVTQIAVSTVVVFLFVVSVVGLALGLGLMLRASATLPFMAFMNRWISAGQAVKPLERPVHIAQGAAGSRWFGLLLFAIGVYAALVLVRGFDVPRLALLFKVDPRYSLASLGLEALKWTLVLGSVAAAVTGFMVLFFPRAWRRIEERANRWYSTRSLEVAGDTVYLTLDRMVEAHPRTAGGVVFLLSLVAAIASGLLLFARR